MTHAKLITPVLIAGCAVLILNFGIRASFGVFQIPIADEFGWARSDFSMAIAIQATASGESARADDQPRAPAPTRWSARALGSKSKQSGQQTETTTEAR